MCLRDLLRDPHQLGQRLVAAAEVVVGPLDGERLGADAGEAGDDVRLRGEVVVAGVGDLEGADQLPADHERRPQQRAAATALEGAAAALVETAPAAPHGDRFAVRQRVRDGRPLGEVETAARAALVELAAVDRHSHPQARAIALEDVAVRRSRELADAPRDPLGHLAGSLDEQRRELEAGAQDGAQVLALAAKPREIAWMCGSISLVGQERQHVRSQIAAVAAWAAVGGDALGVGPAPHGVRADAEQTRDVRHAQPDGPLSLFESSHDRLSCIGRISLKLYQSSQHDTPRREVREDGGS